MPDTTLDSETRTDTPTRPARPLRSGNAWLWIGRGAWLLLVLVSLLTFVVGIRSYYSFLIDNPNAAYTFPEWTPQAMILSLDCIGVSVQSFAALQTTLAIYKFCVYCGLGLFLFIKRSHSIFGLYVSLLLFINGAFWGFHMLTPWTPLVSWMNRVVSGLLLTGVISLVYLFPNGRFVPKWSVVFVPLLFLMFLATYFLIDLFEAGGMNTNDVNLLAVFVLTIGGTLVGLIAIVISMGIAQVYRYRAVSNPIERQQSKWFLFAALLTALFVLMFGIVIPLFYRPFMTPTATGLRYALVANSLVALAATLMPIAIAIAVLRYRLWDIDLIINRTLVYVPLTGILSGVFAVSSDLSKQFLSDLTGATSNGGVVATLLVVAAFDPLKKGLQGLVDRVLKEPPDPTKKLRVYSDQVRDVMQVMDVELSARRLLEEVIGAFGASGGKIVMGPAFSPRFTYVHGDWAEQAALTFVLDYDNIQAGTLFLGLRKNGKPYSAQDRALMEKYLVPVERAIAWAERANSQEVELRE